MHTMPPKQLQIQGMPPANSSSGSWYGVGSVRQLQSVQNNSSCHSGNTLSPGANGRHRVFYEGRPMQKIPHAHVQEYNRTGMMATQAHPNCFITNGMAQRGLGQNEVMFDSPVPHQLLPPGDQQMITMNNPNNDLLYLDQRMRGGCRPMYPHHYDAGPPMQDPSLGPLDGIRSPTMRHGLIMGSELNQEMICQMSGEPVMRGSMLHSQRPMGFSGSQQRVLPYPNPQQYMQNKRAQYSAKRKMYDAEPTMQHYGSGCYGNSWPRQPLSQQPMVSPNYSYAEVPACGAKDESDPYMATRTLPQNHCQLEQWHLSQMNKEPVSCNNAFSPPPGNPTPPMTPGSTSMPSCHLPVDQPEVRLCGSRSFRENEPHFTFAVHEGVIKLPFQLEHNLPVSCHIFSLHDQIHESLMSRSDFELMLKCFHKEDRSMTTNWPATVSICLNEVPLLIDRGNTSIPHHQPVFLKSVCKPGQNTLQISVKACCCSHLFVLQIVHRPTVRSVLHSLMSKRLLPASHSVSKIKRVMSQQQASMTSNGLPNEQLQPFILPLTCPISLQRVRLPSRGQDCRHVQCFDLESYLKMNCEQNQWICPICKKMAALDGLEVDQYIWGILVQLSNTIFDAVIFDASANWKPVPKSEVDYGNDASLCKKFTSVNSMALPNPNTHLPSRLSSSGGLTPSSVQMSGTKEMGVLKECYQRTGSGEATDYLGCLSQMTDVFLATENSQNTTHLTNNLEHVSFPPTPMGSQISTICTPLDGQSLHPRTPSDGNTTHPHTPPDGHPFTPLESQSVYSRTPSENYGSAGGNPRTPSTAYDSKQGTGTNVVDGCTAGGSSGSSTSVGQDGGGKREFPAVQDQPQPSAAENGNSETTDLTKLDFRSDLSMDPMFVLNDDGSDMFSLVSNIFDDDPSDLTSYLGPNRKMAAEQTPVLNKSDDDDDFLSFLK